MHCHQQLKGDREQGLSPHLETIQKVFEVLKIIQTGGMKHPVLVQQLIHDEVHKSNLSHRKVIFTIATPVMTTFGPAEKKYK